MTTPLKLVVVSGSVQRPSKTRVLLDALVSQFRSVLPVNPHWVDLGDIAYGVGSALRRSEVPEEIEAHLRAIESADFLIVGTPVYRASYTGLFKHLFDLIDFNALIDVPVLLTATGGSDRHALVIDHELRPLFSFFQSATLPIGVYGSDGDFTDHRISSPALNERIHLAVNRALPLFIESRNHRVLKISQSRAA